MPQGLDPADVIAKNLDLWKKNLKEAKHIVHFYLDILEENISSPESFASQWGNSFFLSLSRWETK